MDLGRDGIVVVGEEVVAVFVVFVVGVFVVVVVIVVVVVVVDFVAVLVQPESMELGIPRMRLSSFPSKAS